MKKILTTFKFLGLLIAINLLSFSQIAAECTINSGSSTDEFGSISGDILVTQIFTACETGPFKSFAFELKSHGYEAKDVNVSIEPYSVSLRRGLNAFDLGTFDIVPAVNGVKETFTFTPTNNYEVTAGETYQVRMIMDVNFIDDDLRGTASGRSGGFEFSQTISTDDAIGEGEVSSRNVLHSGGATGRMTPALAFNMLLGNPNAAVAPVPTMSQWGLLIFGLLVLNLGLVFVYKKELNY